MLGYDLGFILTLSFSSVFQRLPSVPPVPSTIAMADDGKRQKEDGRESSDPAEEERSWSRVVQGFHRRASWTSHWISEEEIEQLQGFSSRVLQLPHSEVESWC